MLIVTKLDRLGRNAVGVRANVDHLPKALLTACSSSPMGKRPSSKSTQQTELFATTPSPSCIQAKPKHQCSSLKDSTGHRLQQQEKSEPTSFSRMHDFAPLKELTWRTTKAAGLTAAIWPQPETCPQHRLWPKAFPWPTWSLKRQNTTGASWPKQSSRLHGNTHHARQATCTSSRDPCMSPALP